MQPFAGHGGQPQPLASQLLQQLGAGLLPSAAVDHAAFGTSAFSGTARHSQFVLPDLMSQPEVKRAPVAAGPAAADPAVGSKRKRPETTGGKSCSICYRQKIKCCGNRPCERCVKLGRQDQCIDRNDDVTRITFSLPRSNCSCRISRRCRARSGG